MALICKYPLLKCPLLKEKASSLVSPSKIATPTKNKQVTPNTHITPNIQIPSFVFLIALLTL